MAPLIERTLWFIPLDRTYKKYENLYVLGKTWKDRLQNDHNETLTMLRGKIYNIHKCLLPYRPRSKCKKQLFAFLGKKHDSVYYKWRLLQWRYLINLFLLSHVCVLCSSDRLAKRGMNRLSNVVSLTTHLTFLLVKRNNDITASQYSLLLWLFLKKDHWILSIRIYQHYEKI